MNKHIEDIRDDEVRIIGHAPKPTFPVQEKSSYKLGVSIVSAIIVIALGIMAIVFWPKEKPKEPIGGVYENNTQVIQQEERNSTFGHVIDSTKSYTEKVDTVINDVVLSIYIPHNATPELMVGRPNPQEIDIILIAQAADIRGDNFKILGAFVLKGEPQAWGRSKKGFCAIIDNHVTVGVAENSPLFEDAIEKGGYFFRQFALVANGELIENPIKNKAMRKALCSRNGQIFIAVSETDESFHDFTQALVDLGVENAISLVGSHTAYGWFIDEDGQQTMFGEDIHKYENENYLYWRAD